MQQYIGPEGILEKRSKYFYPTTSHFYRNPPQLVRGDMQYLYGHDGKRYIDFLPAYRWWPAAIAIRKLWKERWSSLEHCSIPAPSI